MYLNRGAIKQMFYPLMLCGYFLMNASGCGPYAGDTGYDDKPGKLKLGKTWESNMRVSYYQGGGMMDASQSFDIYTDSVIYKLQENDITNDYRFAFSQKELDNIAIVFYDNNFAGLKAIEREVIYDYPSSTMSICKGDVCTSKSLTATSTFSAAHGKRLGNVEHYVIAAVDAKLEALKQPLTIVLDESLAHEEVNYQLTPHRISYTTGNKDRHDQEIYSVLPGEYMIHVSTYIKDSAGTTQYLLDLNKRLSLENGPVLILSKENGQLVTNIKKQ